MKFTNRLALALMLSMATPKLHADPQLDSWFTTYSGKYARIYTSAANQASSNSVTTWSNGTQTQSTPAYSGVQEVDYSANWVYIRSTGFGSHIMGPWQSGFPNLPSNQKAFYRIPRTPTVPATKSINGGGAIGYFVDGVSMFNSWDAFYWNGSADTGGAGNGGLWNRDAYVNEGATFDPAYAHQPQSGQYHYHANPPALRYFLGDSVTYNAETGAYAENPAQPHHSPILGWVADGFPIYGPYGYSSASNSASGIRRMVSGYALRNGQSGTSNLTVTGRTTLPAWAGRAYNTNTTLTAANDGPAVSASYPLGRYMEDNDYLGDLGYTQGVDFDLDEYNGRYCVTPEFPNGTYAYFVAVNSSGTPVFPYNIGRAYKGSPTGGSVTTLSETVTTNFLGGTNVPMKLNSPAINGGTVTLTWSAIEGGTYQVQGTSDFSSWTVLATNIPAQLITGTTNVTSTNAMQFFRVARTAVAAFDPVSGTTTGGGGGNGILSVSPTSHARGTSFTLTINLDPAATPAPPPQNAPINSVTVGAITGTGNVHVSQTQVTSVITIPANATTGAQTVTVVFPGPPQNPSQTVTYTLPGGFTIN